MESETVELFLHGHGVKPKVALVSMDETLRDVLARNGFVGGADKELLVFVGECDEALRDQSETEDGADKHDPADLERTIEALELHRHRHVHCHRCHRIAVTINFAAASRRHNFSPATPIAVVTEWARKRYHLNDPAADGLVLEICNSNIRPRPDKHLGEIIETADCVVCFDLVPEVTPLG